MIVPPRLLEAGDDRDGFNADPSSFVRYVGQNQFRHYSWSSFASDLSLGEAARDGS